MTVVARICRRHLRRVGCLLCLKCLAYSLKLSSDFGSLWTVPFVDTQTAQNEIHTGIYCSLDLRPRFCRPSAAIPKCCDLFGDGLSQRSNFPALQDVVELKVVTRFASRPVFVVRAESSMVISYCQRIYEMTYLLFENAVGALLPSSIQANISKRTQPIDQMSFQRVEPDI